MQGTGNDAKLNCGLDYHVDTFEELKPDFNASGTYSAHLQTKHSVDIIHHHDKDKVSLKVFFICLLFLFIFKYRKCNFSSV